MIRDAEVTEGMTAREETIELLRSDGYDLVTASKLARFILLWAKVLLLEKELNMSYVFYEDAGHGWLKVPTRELLKLGIVEQITPYSYLSKDGRFAFLEEDCDLTTFVDAKTAIGEKWPYVVRHSERSRIRNYPHYQSDWILEHADYLKRG